MVTCNFDVSSEMVERFNKRVMKLGAPPSASSLAPALFDDNYFEWIHINITYSCVDVALQHSVGAY